MSDPDVERSVVKATEVFARRNAISVLLKADSLMRRLPDVFVSGVICPTRCHSNSVVLPRLLQQQ